MAEVTIKQAELDGDAVHVAGTVDGVEIKVQVWKSHLDTLATKGAKVLYVAQQLKAQAERSSKATLDLTATVTV